MPAKFSIHTAVGGHHLPGHSIACTLSRPVHKEQFATTYYYGHGHLRNNFWACHLTHIVDGNIYHHTKDLTCLEATFWEVSLNTIPWLSRCNTPKPMQYHPLTGPTLTCLWDVFKNLNVSSMPGPMTPTWINTNIELGVVGTFLAGVNLLGSETTG